MARVGRYLGMKDRPPIGFRPSKDGRKFIDNYKPAVIAAKKIAAKDNVDTVVTDTVGPGGHTYYYIHTKDIMTTENNIKSEATIKIKNVGKDGGMVNIKQWWKYSPDKIMSQVYWSKGQLPPSDKNKRDAAWKSLKAQLEKLHPSGSAKTEHVDKLRSVIRKEIQQLNELAIDSDAVRELRLYIDNDSQLYRSRFIPIIKNMIRKRNKGNFNEKLAVKGFMYLVDDAAKKYSNKFNPNTKWTLVFSKEIRMAVAQQYVDEFVAGDYDSYV